MLRTRILVLLSIVFVLATLLAALNPDYILLDLGFVSSRVRLGVALGVTLALGVTAGIVVRVAWLSELLRERGRLRRALKSAETRALASQTRASP